MVTSQASSSKTASSRRTSCPNRSSRPLRLLDRELAERTSILPKPAGAEACRYFARDHTRNVIRMRTSYGEAGGVTGAGFRRIE